MPSLVIWIASLLTLLICPVQAEEPAVSISSAAAVTEPFVAPVGAGHAKIVSKFGNRTIPADATKKEAHEGIDFAVRPGESVKAAKAGKVLFAGFSKTYVSRKDKKEQAHLIIIRHSDGTSTRYVHLNALRVRPPQEVAAGHVIGTASESDEWKVPVLHFEIRDVAGRPLDPEPFLNIQKK